MPNKWTKILHSQTPKKWLRKALESQEILLIDHAHCEKKAATTAISLIHRYPDKNLAKKLISIHFIFCMGSNCAI